MPETKPFWKSKTVWFNVGMGVLLVVVALMKAIQGGDTELSADELNFPDTLSAFVKYALLIGNLILRIITKNAVALRTPKTPPPAGPTGTDQSFRVFPPAAALLAVLSFGACAEAQNTPVDGKPLMKIDATDPTIPGHRLIIDARECVADRIEFVVWADGLSKDGGLEQFREAIEKMRELGADVTLPPEPAAEGYMSRFSMESGRVDVVVLDTIAGSHYRVSVTGFTSGEQGGTETVKLEFKIPSGPAPPPGPQPPTPPPPTPPNPEPTPPQPTPPGPQPPVPPTPPEPNPEPQIPEGRFKIARKVYEAAKQVDSPNRRAEASGIASVLRAVASDVKDGTTRGSESIRQSLMTKLDVQLDDAQAARWSPGFGLVLARIIFDLLSSGQLGTWEDWVDLLLEIAAALELVL